MQHRLPHILVLLALIAAPGAVLGSDAIPPQPDARFHATVQPFLQTYCITCHGKDKTEAELDLTIYSSLGAVVKDGRRGGLVLERLKAEENPHHHPSF